MERSEFYGDARRDLAGPLAGLRVLEATTTWAGPMCGCLLADFGADVVKVEHPEGEVARRSPPFLPGSDPPVSFMHATVNRNKRSLTLELRCDEGRALFLELARRADIVIENFRPGTATRWGIDYAAVASVRPDVIYVSISGYGQWGPNWERVGYDPLAQAASGFLSLNGEPEGVPVKAPTFLADDLGGLHGALGALAALCHRHRTGEGQHVDVSLLDATLFQSNGFLTLGALGVAYPRLGNEYPFAAPARVFACKDGSAYLGVLLDSHWKALARVMGRPELGEDPDYAVAPNRLGRRAEVNEILAAWAAERSVAEVIAALTAAGLPCAPVRGYAEAARDPHVLERDMLQPTVQPDGTEIPITGPAGKFSRTPTRVRRAAPAAGADQADILGELGLDGDEIAALQEAGAFGSG